MQWLQSESAIYPTPSGIPRRVLRHLIVSHDVGVGSRVLDVGCGNGELVRFLDELGIKAAGVATNAIDLRTARASSPGLEFFEAQDLPLLAADQRSFDLVIVRDFATHGENLFRPAAFDVTAGLIEVLRPGGSLAFLQQPHASSAQNARHAASCFSRHLCIFPGHCKTSEFSESGQIDAIRRMFGPPASDQVVTATYCRPLESSTHYEWRAIGRVAAASHRDKCCFGHSASHSNRRAA